MVRLRKQEEGDRRVKEPGPREGTLVVARTGADSITDAELVGRARTRDAWAYEVIFRRHSPGLLNMVVRMLGKRDEARDVVQETFIAAFARLDQLREPSSFRVWLRNIAVRRVYRTLRKRRWLGILGLETNDGDAPLASLADPGAGPEVIAELKQIDGLLSRLPAEERIAWTLRHVEGESLEDIAAVLGCSLATAKRRIKHGQERISRQIGSEDEP